MLYYNITIWSYAYTIRYSSIVKYLLQLLSIKFDYLQLTETFVLLQYSYSYCFIVKLLNRCAVQHEILRAYNNAIV